MSRPVGKMRAPACGGEIAVEPPTSRTTESDKNGNTALENAAQCGGETLQ